MYVCMYVYVCNKIFIFSNKSCSFELSIHKSPEIFYNILNSTTGFNIDTNNKCLYNSKSAYKSDF